MTFSLHAQFFMSVEKFEKISKRKKWSKIPEIEFFWKNFFGFFFRRNETKNFYGKNF